VARQGPCLRPEPRRPDRTRIALLFSSRLGSIGLADRVVLAQIDKYYEKAEFPFELLPKLKELGIMGGTIKGYGCPVPRPSLHVVRAVKKRARGQHTRTHTHAHTRTRTRTRTTAHAHRACRS
jgi:hypothetical protein